MKDFCVNFFDLVKLSTSKSNKTEFKISVDKHNVFNKNLIINSGYLKSFLVRSKKIYLLKELFCDKIKK